MIRLTHIKERGYTMIISRERALHIIWQHGWVASDQTATIDGEWAAEGTSFDEMLGFQHSYKKADVMSWLGY